MYYTEYRIYGIHQDQFSFTTERAEVHMSAHDYADFRKAIAALPLKGLNPASGTSSGSIDLEPESFQVTAPPDAEVRKKWQAVLNAFLKKQTVGKLKRMTETVQGETVAPVAITFPQLLGNRKAYNGKRIRINGYWHGGFECSSFSASKEKMDDYKESIWLDGASTFADPANIDERNNRMLTVEGTFKFGPGGHLGAYMAEISRTTYSKPSDIKATEAEDLYISKYPTWRSKRGR